MTSVRCSQSPGREERPPVRVRCPRHQVLLQDIGILDFASSRHALAHQASVASDKMLDVHSELNPPSAMAEY
eukprot:1207753-Amphidinium_carterae.1